MIDPAHTSDPHAWRARIERRLEGSRPQEKPDFAALGGPPPEAVAVIRASMSSAPIPAAVLVPLIERPEGLTVLFTQRAAHLTRHASQISFPGGRIEARDEGALEAALRETEEEIGLTRSHVEIAGYLDPYLVLTGYWITPVVAFVRPDFQLRLDPREVESVFEAPLAHIFDPRNHLSSERLIGATPVQIVEIPYGPHRIWGATAGMLINLYRLATGAR